MQMTERGLLALAGHEGVVPAPYRDSTGTWTFGIGHTAAAGPPDPAEMPRGMPADLDAGIVEAFRVFRADLARYEAEVLAAVTVPLAPHEFDALVSFHYNTGGIARASADPPPERRRPRGRGAGLPELAAAGGDHPPARGGARPVPPWPLSRRGHPGLVRGSCGPRGLLAAVRRLAESEALALLRPSEPDAPVTPTPTGWLARLAALSPP